jgi:uncharacterized Fe-S center protein
MKRMNRREFISSLTALTTLNVLSGCAPAGTKVVSTSFSMSESLAPESTAAQSAAAGCILTNDGTQIALEALEHQSADAAAKVYYTSLITPEAMVNAYEQLGFAPTGKVAVKLSTGEPPASNFLSPDLIKDLVQNLDGTIVECNTAYSGPRSRTEEHYQVAKDHGFTDIAEVDIMDAEGSLSLPVDAGGHLAENLVGSHFSNYGSFVVLSHFKGHTMAGYGGAIKNISIGIASAEGKANIHTGGKGGSIPKADHDTFLESMGEAGKAVVTALGGQIVYVNVMNRLSVDCDCDSHPAPPKMNDIGILSSADPVALDQACIDLVYAAPDNDALVTRIETRNGLHTLENAEALGLGSRNYQLIDIDT